MAMKHTRGRPVFKGWDEEVYKALIRMYFKVTKLQTDRVLIPQRLYQLFKQQYPHMRVTKNYLSEKRKLIVKKQLLPLRTINSLREEVARELQEEEREHQDDSCSPGSPTPAAAVKVSAGAFKETSKLNKQQPDDELQIVTAENKCCNPDNTEKAIIDTKANNRKRRHNETQFGVYKMDRNKVLEELEKIPTITSDVADKTLAIEVRNTWGPLFCENHEDSARTRKIYLCLSDWLAWVSLRGGDTPVAYVCYVCNVGWWHLAPFRDHVNSNHVDVDLKINFAASNYESVIVAKVNKASGPISINGACPKCGSHAVCHQIIFLRCRAVYRCTYCDESFGTCGRWSLHMGSCRKYLDYVRTSPVIDNLYSCHLCAAVREKLEMMEVHYIYSHSVRSDVPAYMNACGCMKCGQLKLCSYVHVCPARRPSKLCLWCIKRFPTVHLLKLHEAVNKDQTQCPLCMEMLPTKCSVVAHMTREHSDNFLRVSKCVFCEEHTVFLNDEARSTHYAISHFKTYYNSKYAFTVVIPKTCIPLEDILKYKVVTAARNKFGPTYRRIAPKITPNITDLVTTPSDNLDQVVIKDVCGNYVDNIANDSRNAEGEYPNIKTEPMDVGKQQIKEKNEINDEERKTENEFETIVKEEIIFDYPTINYGATEDNSAEQIKEEIKDNDEERITGDEFTMNVKEVRSDHGAKDTATKDIEKGFCIEDIEDSYVNIKTEPTDEEKEDIKVNEFGTNVKEEVIFDYATMNCIETEDIKCAEQINEEAEDNDGVSMTGDECKSRSRV